MTLVGLRLCAATLAVAALVTAGCASTTYSSGPALGATSSQTVTTSTNGTTAVTLAQIASGVSGSVTLPQTSVSTTASLEMQSTLPNGIPQPAARTRSPLPLRPDDIGGTVTALVYVTLSVDPGATISQTPAFSFTFSGTLSGNIYLVFYNPASVTNTDDGWSVISGPAAPSANSVTFGAETISPPLTLVASTTYVFAVVETSTALPSPSPSPTSSSSSSATPSPTPSPTATASTPGLSLGPVVTNPTSLSFIAAGASYAQNLDISQTNFTGSYSEGDNCSGIATVSPTSNSGGAAVYAVTPVAAGTCQVTVTGGGSMQAVVGVIVTTSTVIVR
ncbi:MAG TPA: hypothetical protein VMD47_09115 [Candidatus Acidoferrales bacterium]|nr:hypothetical protein [Candidatus Acidoferrales bacterium]